MPINPNMPTRVSEPKMKGIIVSCQPLGKFYCNIENRWVACDNSTGCAFVEEFEKLGDVLRWLRGEFEVTE